jgi:hypothetical protein
MPIPARRSVLLVLLCLGTGVLGCDTTATQPESQVVVESYLQAGEPLPPIRLSRTVSVDETYDPTESAIEGATVVVDSLADDGTPVGAVSYTESDSVPGLYTPVAAEVVRAQATYRLRVTTTDGAEVTATTTVPGPVDLVDTENDTTLYQSPRQPSLTIRAARQGGLEGAGGQNVFTLTTTALLDFATTPTDSLRAALTPFYADGFDPEEDSIGMLRVNSSGLLNEANFNRNADDTITIDVPWLAIAFFGPNEVGVSVVDENYFDLLRSQNAQQGGFAPGEIPNVIEHVEGGTGVFGSYARAAHPVLIRRPAGQP